MSFALVCMKSRCTDSSSIPIFSLTFLILCVQVEAQQYFSTCDCPDYLQIAEKRLDEEKERVINYLDPSTEPKITRVLENELISKQASRLNMLAAKISLF